MENEKKPIADKAEVLEVLTRILRCEETEDSVVKVREETKTTEEDGRSFTDRGERVQLVKVRPRIADRIRAAELLGKAQGVFGDRVQATIALPVAICGEDDLT